MPIKQPINVLLSDGGMGDLICALVAINYNINQYTNAQFLVWVPDYMVEFCKHVLPPGTSVRSYSEGKTKFNDKYPGVSTSWTKQFHSPMRTHPVDYAFHVLSDCHIYDLNKKNYLKIKPERINLTKYHLPEKYVVISCAAVVKIKEMPISTLNEISDYIISKGYTPVYLGKEKEETGIDKINLEASAIKADYSKGINLINKSTLLDSAGIINGAKAIVGIDGGLMHIAGFTDTNIICGYTLVDPIHIAPYRNGGQTYKFQAVVPDEDLPNRFYQTYNNFDFGVLTTEFPGWEKIIASMTSDKFIKALENVL